MTLTLTSSLPHLSSSSAAIAALARNVSDEQARWKPSADEWSILEVVCHLDDEEREDFRTRVDYALHRPEEAWPPINPQGWVTERGYNQRDLKTMLDSFLQERQASLKWLAALQHPNWESTHVSPVGAMSAGEVLAAWLAHDHLHIRQLNELHWQWLARDVAPLSLDYAGGW